MIRALRAVLFARVRCGLVVGVVVLLGFSFVVVVFCSVSVGLL